MSSPLRGIHCVIAMAIAFSCGGAAESRAQSVCPPRGKITYRILKRIPRSRKAFTQGLVYAAGKLYESSGGYGNSSFNRIDPGNGQTEVLGRPPGEVFTEGLGVRGDRFYQLTWKENRLFIWSRTGKMLGETNYAYPGWGLTRTRDAWVSSDGSSTLRFFRADPKVGAQWIADSELTVRDRDGEVSGLNALAFSDAGLWANLYPLSKVVQISPKTGCVLAELDLSELTKDAGIDLAHSPDSVLNGIAFESGEPRSKSLYVTGKNWGVIYQLVLAFPFNPRL